VCGKSGLSDFEPLRVTLNTDANVCPAMVRSVKHKLTNKNWIRKIKKDLFELNDARSTVLESSCCRFSRQYSYHGVMLTLYFSELFIRCHVKSVEKIHGTFSLVRSLVIVVDQICLILLERRKMPTRIVGNGSLLSPAAGWIALR
jgi:hypothetical protein